MIQKYSKRFENLETELLIIENLKHTPEHSIIRDAKYIDHQLFDEWRVKVKTLIVNSCGNESEHYKEFLKAETPKSYDTNYSMFLRTKAVFHTAHDDYSGGYLNSMKSIVQAEIFDIELDQAKELLNKGYYVAAAVIAGVVIETGLRELCINNNIIVGKLNKMNDDLAKKGIYNSLIQKQITAIAGIRNSAAHGKIDEFNIDQVKNMINEIENILAYNLN
jgi:hypothetical protein